MMKNKNQIHGTTRALQRRKCRTGGRVHGCKEEKEVHHHGTVVNNVQYVEAWENEYSGINVKFEDTCYFAALACKGDDDEEQESDTWDYTGTPTEKMQNRRKSARM
jgi:hypothetical protein